MGDEIYAQSIAKCQARTRDLDSALMILNHQMPGSCRTNGLYKEYAAGQFRTVSLIECGHSLPTLFKT